MLKNDQILVQAEKKKKGDGIKAVLTLTQELRDFQDQVEKCLESQDLEEIRARIESFDDSLNEMYNELLDIAKGNIKSLRKTDDLDVEDVEEDEGDSGHSLSEILDIGDDVEVLEPVPESKGINVFQKLEDYGPLFPKAPVRPLR